MVKFVIIFFLLIFLPAIISAQYKNIKFEHLTVEQGLSQNNIMCILQDTHGFLWIGTHDGLNKYDGYRFAIYRHDPDDSLSLSANWITWLYEDRSGTLWITTKGGGLNRFDREKEKFVHYSGINVVTMDKVSGFQYEGKRVIWIGASNGLNKLDITTQKFTHYPHTKKKGSPYSYVESMVVDNSGIVWVGSSGDGLHKFNPETEKFTHYRHDILNPSSLSSNKIMSVYLDKSGILWVGTRGGGLNKFDQKKEQFIHYKHDPGNVNSLSSNHIWSIFEDRSGILWVGTNDEGLNRFDRDTGQITHYKHESGNTFSLKSNFIRYIYQDKTDILWIGTVQGGLHKYNPQKMQFTLYQQKFSYSGNLLNTSVSSIYETNYKGENILWIGTLSEGLYKIDRETGQMTNYRYDPNNSNSLSSNIITYCLESTFGARRVLWISTFNGLNKFDHQTEQFTRYFHNPDDPYSISGNLLRTLFEDKNGVLWIGTQTGGLNKLNRETEQFSRLGPRLPVTKIYEDKSGVLWIAAWLGLRKLDRNTGNFITYMRNRDAQNYAELNRTNTIHESHFAETDILWTGTFSGLNKFDRKSEKFINYTVKDGLPNNVINGILEDNHGNLWLSTNKGLSKFNPKTNIFRNYDVHDGLLNEQYNFDTCYKSKNGEFFFGGTNGIDAFYPDNIKDNLRIPPVIITDFQIFNKPVKIKRENNAGSENDYFLPKNINTIEEIELSYRENVFSIEFAALDYHAPQKNLYAYKMEGVDPDWVHTDASRRFATYTNLYPGEYTFRVKGSNNDGVWNEEGTSIKITITPPWWQAWWFRIFTGFMFIGVLVWAYNNRVSSLRKKHQTQKEFSRKLIDAQEKERKRIASALHDSHGQNLLIISNVMQQYVDKHKDSKNELKQVTDTVQESINEIREISYNLHPHQLERIGLNEALDSMINKVSKSSEIQFDLVMDDIKKLFDKKMEINLYRIIQEAVNNIIRHSKATEAKVEIKKNIKYVTISISDNGKGFDKNLILKANNGLGLVGMKERVNLINGQFKLKTEKGGGTRIEISIPFKT